MRRLPASTWARARLEAVSLLGYVLLALWWTWPLALHWSTHIAGGHGPLSIGDNLQFAWNFDHVARSWAQNRSAFSDSNLFFPHPASLALHTMQWHHSALAALAWKISPSLSLSAICNSLLLGTLCLNATATRLLCRRALWRVGLLDERTAWLIGAGAALGPISQARSFGHWNLLAWGYLPLLMLALLHLDEALASDAEARSKYLGRALGRAMLAALCVALAGWCDVQFVLFAALWAAAFFVVSRHPSRLRRAAWWGAAFVGGVALLSPMLATMMSASKDAQRMAIAPPWALDVANLLSPSPWHPLLGRFAFADVRADGIEWVVAPGLALLALGVWGWRSSPQAARPWAWSALALWILACGPGLQIAQRPVVSPFAPAAQITTANASAATSREAAWQRAVTMPFAWLRQSVGPLKSFRVPARFAIPALACWSVCATLGLSSLSRKYLQRSSLILMAAAALVLCDIWRAPLPSFDARTPRWAEIIRDTRGDSGVVPLPIAFNDWRLSWAMWGQTIHHKPLFCAYLSRAPRDLQGDAVRDSPLWRALTTWAQSDDPAKKLALRASLPAPEQAARDLALWRAHGARFLLWQRGAARREDEILLRQMLRRSKAATLVSEDESALLWEITSAPGARSAAARVTLQANLR